jgi:glycerophosphoryl diester phosphodiesterase
MKTYDIIRVTAACAVLTVCAAVEAAPLIQAHRGSRGEYDDNARGGFERCLARGIRGYETDIRFSKDHKLVIMHDSRVERTTDGKGVIEEMTLDEIKKCRLNNCSEPVPTAEEVMSVLKGRKDTFIELEMKAYPSNPFYTPEVLEEYCRALNTLAKKTLEPGTYAFTSFDKGTLATMKKVDPDALIGYIVGSGLTDSHLETAKALGCRSVAPLLSKTTKEMVDKAHSLGMTVCLWMVQNAADYGEAAAKGADRVTSDYPMLLQDRVNGRRKKLLCFDLDATLCQHRSPIPEKNMNALKLLEDNYKCIMVGAGNAPRIYKQMGDHPIDIVANYGMQESTVTNGEFMIVRAVTNTVDRQFFREKTDYLRKKYGYTEYEGEPLEFHASGMVTFGLLGTKPSAEHKVAFDPDRKKRRAMYKEVCEIFKDFSVYIGGSTSFDFAGPQYNKYDATLNWALRHGYTLEDICFVGDDYADGGGDSHVRIKGMDHIVITDYRNFAKAMSVLLK